MSPVPTWAQHTDQRSDLSRIAGRLGALEKLLTLLEGRVSDSRLRPARQVAHRVDERLTLSPAHTVVAVAGATGSGKSSLFNSVVGLEISAVGLRRPTTGVPQACVWGPEGAAPLLGWLGIPEGHQIERESALDADTQAGLRGLVLLDLPDHDSIEFAHRLEVDRLVELVDLLVWVLDPQKYADEVVHARYLRPLSRHSDVIVVALNQVDLLTAEETEACVRDVRRLLDADGLRGARLLATSAERGTGLNDLRDVLTETVAARRAAMLRLAADLDVVAARMDELAGAEVREDVDRSSAKALYGALGEAAGVPAVGEAVERGYRHRARRMTGWPIARWLGRSRPDPLRKLQLEGQPARPGSRRVVHNAAATVQTAEVEEALHQLTQSTASNLPAPWPSAVHRAARSELEDLPAALEHAVATTDLGLRRKPPWWRLVNAAQWLLTAALFIGAVWLVTLSVMKAVGADEPSTPLVGNLALPAALVLGGLVLGPALGLVSRSMARTGAQHARARAEHALVDAVTGVARERVLAPVRAELGTYAKVREEVAVLSGLRLADDRATDTEEDARLGRHSVGQPATAEPADTAVLPPVGPAGRPGAVSAATLSAPEGSFAPPVDVPAERPAASSAAVTQELPRLIEPTSERPSRLPSQPPTRPAGHRPERPAAQELAPAGGELPPDAEPTEDARRASSAEPREELPGDDLLAGLRDEIDPADDPFAKPRFTPGAPDPDDPDRWSGAPGARTEPAEGDHDRPPGGGEDLATKPARRGATRARARRPDSERPTDVDGRPDGERGPEPDDRPLSADSGRRRPERVADPADPEKPPARRPSRARTQSPNGAQDKPARASRSRAGADPARQGIGPDESAADDGGIAESGESSGGSRATVPDKR